MTNLYEDIKRIFTKDEGKIFYLESSFNTRDKTGEQIMKGARKVIELARKENEKGTISSSFNFIYGDLMRAEYGAYLNPSEQRELKKYIAEAKKYDKENGKRRKEAAKNGKEN